MDNVNKRKEAGKWFFAIAIFSFLGSLLSYFGFEHQLVFSLAVSQVVDGISINLSNSLSWINILFSAIISLVFLFLGRLTIKGNRIAYTVGILLYILDSIILIYIIEYISIMIHIFVLIMLFKSFKYINIQSKP